MSANRDIASQIPDNYEPLKGSERRPSAKAKLLGPAAAEETLSVTIVLRRRPGGPPVPGHEYFANTPPSRRPRMPPEEFAAKYGASDEDIAKVVDFASGHNLSIVGTHRARRTVLVSGTVVQMSKAFAVTLGRYQHEVPNPRRGGGNSITETYRGRDGFVYVPKDLTSIIVGVFGLDNRCVTHRNGKPGDPKYTNPVAIQTVMDLYNFPKFAADGQTIGIVAPAGPASDFNPTGTPNGYLDSDIEESTSLRTVLSVIPVSVDGSWNAVAQAVTTTDTPLQYSYLDPPPVMHLKNIRGVITQGAVVSGSPGIDPDPFFDGITVAAVKGTTVTLSQSVSHDFPAGSPVFFNLNGPSGETTQDICIAASAAPGADVAVYFSEDDQQGWVRLVSRVIHPEPGDPVCSVLSSSYFISPGDDSETLAINAVSKCFIHAVDAAFQDAALQGVTVCVSSGDYGSNSEAGKGTHYSPGDGRAHVQFPASDPWVLSVGGTTIGGNAGHPPPFVEYVWNDPDPESLPYPGWGTTGGGVSDFFGLPSYQINAGVPKSVNSLPMPKSFGGAPTGAEKRGRGVPDVAGNASLNSGYSGLFWGNKPTIGNGTSASTPLWAGLIATLNAYLRKSVDSGGYNVGFVNPILYSLGSSVFRDINPPPGPTNNSNEGIPGYNAGPGWDACTGWGSPNGMALFTALYNLERLIAPPHPNKPLP